MEPVQRFETPPGHQGQVDFADFRLPWGKRHALIVVLGYSRRMWLRFYERQTMPVVMRGLEASFAYFGGVPSELLFDQMKAVITGDKRDEGGRLVENPESCASAATGASGSAHADRTGPRRRGRSSGRSAISGTTSSTARSSCPTTTSTRGSCCGSMAWRTFGSTVR